MPVGPTKVKVRKSILFTEGTPEVEIKEHLFDSVGILYFYLNLGIYILLNKIEQF